MKKGKRRYKYLQDMFFPVRITCWGEVVVEAIMPQKENTDGISIHWAKTKSGLSHILYDDAGEVVGQVTKTCNRYTTFFCTTDGMVLFLERMPTLALAQRAVMIAYLLRWNYDHWFASQEHAKQEICRLVLGQWVE